MMKTVYILGLILASCSAMPKTTSKRGVADFGFGTFGGTIAPVGHDVSFGFAAPWAGSAQFFPRAASFAAPGFGFGKALHYVAPISPAEIATAVAAAKDASAAVQYAQDRVHAAKEAVIHQQRIAQAKEAQANLALKQSEAAAAIQRQSASAAAQAVVLAQQKLAEAKAEVADRQRIAAAKEALAASAIQKSASAAAAEIQRTEHTAAKIAALQRSEAAAAIQHVSAAKDATLAATAAAVAAANQIHHALPQPGPGPDAYAAKSFPIWS